MDFNPVPLPLSLQAELDRLRGRRLERIKERPARKDDEVGHDPGKGDQAEHLEKKPEKAVVADLEALR